MSDPFAQFNTLPQQTAPAPDILQQTQRESQTIPMHDNGHAQNISMYGSSFQNNTNVPPQRTSYQQGLPVFGDASLAGSQQSMNPNLGIYTPQENIYAQPTQMGQGLMPMQPMGRPRFNTYSAGPGMQQGPPTSMFANMSLAPPAEQFQEQQQQSNYDQPQVSQPMRFRSHAVSVSGMHDENTVNAPFSFGQPVVETDESQLDPFDMFDPVPRARGKTVGASSAAPPEVLFGQSQQRQQPQPDTQPKTVDPFDLFLAVNAESRNQAKVAPPSVQAVQEVVPEPKPEVKVENSSKTEKVNESTSDVSAASNDSKGSMDVAKLKKDLFFYPGHRGYIVDGIKHRRALGGKYSVKPLRAAAIRISADKDGVIIMSQEGKSILHRFDWEKIIEMHHVHVDKLETPLNRRTRKNFLALQLMDGSVFVINSKQTPEIRALFAEVNPKVDKE